MLVGQQEQIEHPERIDKFKNTFSLTSKGETRQILIISF